MEEKENVGGWEEGLIVEVSRTFPPLLLSSLSLSYSLFLSECVCVCHKGLLMA